jgi:phage tail-like protein
MTEMGKRVDPLTTCNFCVEIEGIGQAVFREFSGFEAEVEVYSYEEGGYNFYSRKLPGRTKFSNITLKRGIAPSDDLWLWFQYVASGDVSRRHVSIVAYDAAHRELRRWNIFNAFPVKWVCPAFRADENAVAIETLELAHEGVTVAGGSR